METITAPFQRLSEKLDALQNNLNEIYSIFQTVKNIVFAIFAFLGQETAVLLFCTVLFVIVLNLIPFLFFGKKARYYAGTGFGVWLAFKFDYSLYSTAKFLLVMFSPVLLEIGLVFLLKKTGVVAWRLLKKLWGLMKKLWGASWNAVRSKLRRKKDAAP